MAMSIVLIGCVEIGLKALQELVEAGHAVAGVVTLAGRRCAATSGYVDFEPYCRERGLPLVACEDVNAPEVLAWVRERNPRLIVVCGWQRLLGPDLLAIPPAGSVGFHSSMLPRYRGRAPINWAIIHGERETGVTMFMLDEAADAGGIVDQEPIPIDPLDTCAEVYDKAAQGVRRLLRRRLPDLLAGRAELRENTAAAHPCLPRRTPADGLVDWTWPVLRVHDFVRALGRPYPGAFTDVLGDVYFLWRAVPLHPGLGSGPAPGRCRLVRGLGLVCGCGDGGSLLVTAGAFQGEGERRPDLDPRLAFLEGES